MGDSAAHGQPLKHSVTQLDAGTPTSLERSYGVTLSNDVDSDRIVARVQPGVLALEIPKAERAKPRRIAVGS